MPNEPRKNLFQKKPKLAWIFMVWALLGTTLAVYLTSTISAPQDPSSIATSIYITIADAIFGMLLPLYLIFGNTGEPIDFIFDIFKNKK